MQDEIIIVCKSKTYMSVKDMAEWYSCTPQTIRRNVQVMKSLDRYNPRFVSLDDEGKMLINSLMYEDYLAHKTALKNRTLARRLPPYDPGEVRRQRGDSSIPQNLFRPSELDREEARNIVKEILKEGLGA